MGQEMRDFIDTVICSSFTGDGESCLHVADFFSLEIYMFLSSVHRNSVYMLFKRL